jgi:hypothetical protein
MENPSKININLSNVIVDAFYKDTHIGRVLPMSVTLKASGKTPLNLPLQINESKILTLAKDIFSQNKVEVIFKCLISFKALGYVATIPYDLKIDIKQQLMEYVQSSLLKSH